MSFLLHSGSLGSGKVSLYKIPELLWIEVSSGGPSVQPSTQCRASFYMKPAQGLLQLSRGAVSNLHTQISHSSYMLAAEPRLKAKEFSSIPSEFPKLLLPIPRPGAEQLQLFAAGEGFVLRVFAVPLAFCCCVSQLLGDVTTPWPSGSACVPVCVCAVEAYRQLT